MTHKFKVGDRVLVGGYHGEPCAATVAEVREGAGQYHVTRDDGVRCGGAWWACESEPPEGFWIKPIAGEPAKTEPPTTKQDSNKPRWSKLFSACPKALRAVLKVVEEGEAKYGDGNTWRTVESPREADAAQRHLMDYWAGARVNEADGDNHHLAHAIVDLLFELDNELEGRGK